MNSNIAAEYDATKDEHVCTICRRPFRTGRGLNQHLRTCLKSTNEINKPPKPPPDEPPLPGKDHVDCSPSYQWGKYECKIFEKNLNFVYESIVYWRKNLFLLPTGKAGKSFIDETTRLMNGWSEDSPLRQIAFKAIMVMPNLLLQKPSKNSQSKEDNVALQRRMLLWNNGMISKNRSTKW